MRILFIFSVVVFPWLVIAQPANNNCVDAITINNLNGGCNSYSVQDATIDIGTGPCGNYDPNESANVWFSFTAQGSNIEIDLFTDPADAYQINIVEFNGPDCDPNSAVVLACADRESLVFNGLVENEEYFIMLAFIEQTVDEVEICINNPPDIPAPPNDNPCDAIVLSPNGGCHNGTTEEATPAVLNPNCQGNSQSSVWYSVTLTGSNNILEVDLSGLSLPGDVSVIVGQFASGCTGNFTIAANGSYCGPPNTVVIATGLNSGETYFIGIASSPDDQGSFSVCVQQSGPPPGCSENDACSDAESLGTIPSSTETVTEPPVCTEGCNIASSPEFSIPNCIPASWGSVFYSFTTDAVAERISITVESDNMQSFGAAIFSGSCANPNVITCATTNNGTVNLTNIFVNANTTYYIMVASSTGNTGEFELCVSSFNLPEQCIPAGSEPTIEVTNTSLGSPPEGPFQAGEEVTFLYTLPSYQATATIQWLQALIPVFGAGWAPSSFDAQGRPINSGLPNSANGATWAWWDQYQITYNGNSTFYSTYINDVGRLALCYWTDPNCDNTGLNAGDGLPSGWYAFSPGNGPTCMNNGNPNFGWGDGNQGPWTVEFTLTVRDFSGPEGCVETEFLDLSVRVFTMSDAQVGCWTGGTPNACAGDDFATAGELLNQCCESPNIDLVDEQICSGEQTNIVLTSDQDPFVIYSWTVNAPPSVSGAEDGNGQFITQTLINTSNQPQVVFYNVSGENESESCLANTVSIPVTVYPDLIVNLGPDIEGCAQGEFSLGQNLSITGGSFGPFVYQWSGNLGNDPNPVVSPNISTTYSLTVTDQNGCSGTDQITVLVSPAILLEVSPERIFCEEDGPLEILVTPTTGQAPFQFNWASPMGSLTGSPIEATMSGTYMVEVTDANGCTGERSMEITMHETPVHAVFTVPNDIDSICPGEQIDLFSIPSLGLPPYSYIWTSPGGDQQFSQNIIVEFSGTHLFEVEDGNGCRYIDSIVLANRPPPEPNISGSSSLCEGSTSTLTLDQSYDEVLWSTGESSEEIEIGEPGIYSVTVTVGFGCQGETSFEVESIPVPTITFTGPNALCEESISSISVVETYASYLWDDGSNLQSLDIVGPGEYSVTVTNAEGCTSEASFTVDLDQSISFSLLPGDTTICPEDSITLMVIENFASYLWSDSSTTQSLTVSAPGIYSVTIVDSEGCVGEQFVEISQFDPPNVEITGDLEFCFSTQTELGLTGEFFSYNWSDGSTDSILIVGESGDFAVSVLDFNGCSGVDSVTLTELDEITPQIEGVLSFCPGDTVVLGSSEEFASYLWSTGEISQSILISQPDSIFLTVTDQSGCTGEVEVETEEFTPPSPQISGSSSFCIGNSTTIDAGSGYDMYLWNTGDSSQTLIVSAEGQYSVTVVDQNGCTGEVAINITEEENLMPAISPDQPGFCPGQSVEVSVGTGFASYEWNTGETGNSILVGAPGVYEVTVMDADGCSGTASVEVVEYPNPEPVINGDGQICWNGSTILTVSPDFVSYEWNTGENSQSIEVESGGVFTLLVTDGNECRENAEFEVIQLDQPEVIVEGEFDICSGEATEISVLDAFDEYFWSDGSTGSTLIISEPGNYSIVVTDSDGCTGETSFEISAFPDPVVSIEGANTFCEGFSTTLNAGAGFLSYLWSNGSDADRLEVFSAGIYRVTVTDLNGCTAEDSFEVAVATELSPEISGPERLCLGTSAELSTGNFEAYIWNTGSTQQSITISSGGIYSVSVEDSDGCTGEVVFEVVEVAPPFADVIAFFDVCNTMEDTSSIDFNSLLVGGDTGGFWEDIQNSGAAGNFPILDFDGIAPGEYVFRYTTNSADFPCEEVVYETTILVRDCDCPNPSFSNPGPLCNDGELIDLNDYLIEFTDGLWEITKFPGNDSPDILDGSLLNISNIEPGEYRISFTVSAAPEGCPLTEERTVVINRPLSAGVSVQGTVVCFGESVDFDLFGLLSGEDIGGTWSEISDILSTNNAFDPNSATFNTGDQIPGLYRFAYRIESSNPCPDDESVVEIRVAPLPIADAGQDDAVTCADPEAILGGNSTSQGSEFSYIWSVNGMNLNQNERFITVNSGGSYLLEVENTETGCRSMDQVIVEEFKDPVTDVFFEVIDPVCVGESTGCITIVDVEGGNAPFQFSLNNGVFTDQQEFCALPSGTYTLEVIDFYGCNREISIAVTEPDELFVNLGFDLFVPQGDSISIPFSTNAPDGAIELLEWFINGTNADCSFCENYSFEANESFNLAIELVTSEGCSAMDDMIITVTKERKYFAPNVIRPNSTIGGGNANFTLYGEEGTLVRILELKIFDRWGTQVFERLDFPPNQPELGWDGTFKDREVGSTLFFFYAEILYDNNRKEIISGEFSVLK